MNKDNILILGSTGMLGRAIFIYLRARNQDKVWGTTRNKRYVSGKLLYFSAENYKKDFDRIQKTVNKIDYIINCIAILNEKRSVKDLLYTNSLFPHLLEGFAEKNGCKLIHISTDAVFSPTVGKVNESSQDYPTSLYGRSKLLGETVSQNSLTFRSSFIGFDPIGHKGLLEKLLQSEKNFSSITNQSWTGCTTLQFAKFCEDIISENTFSILRKKSNLYHFFALGPIPKYKLAEIFVKALRISVIIKKLKNGKTTRQLSTRFSELLKLYKYKKTVEQSLLELIEFENEISQFRKS